MALHRQPLLAGAYSPDANAYWARYSAVANVTDANFTDTSRIVLVGQAILT